MRLFIAINFDDKIKLTLAKIQDLLKKHALRGRWTRMENMHLTLVFLGEVEVFRLDALKKVMDNIIFSPFQLTVTGISSFKRDGGDIYWAGVGHNETLLSLQNKLCHGLFSNGFKAEQKKFIPHLTLGREIVVNPEFDTSILKMPDAKFLVDRISLMKSEHLNGKLTYTEIYCKK